MSMLKAIIYLTIVLYSIIKQWLGLILCTCLTVHYEETYFKI